MQIVRRPRTAWLASLVLLTLFGSGCASGPDYAGGPSSEDPHGVVSPGDGITIWAVDGYATASRAFSVMVAPGRRKLKVRLEHPIESEAWAPFEYKTLTFEVEQGVTYYLSRKESEFPPYEIEVKESGAKATPPPGADD